MPDRLTLPIDRDAVLELYFAEHRAKLLDIAAFLDRVDRAADANPGEPDDFRLVAFRRALGVVADGRPQRARRILELLSDPTGEPVGSTDSKRARGAWPGIANAAGGRP